MKIFFAAPPEQQPPLWEFLNAQEPKLRQKMFTLLAMLSGFPALGEPYVKHFTLARYSQLYELRAKSKVMARIIYTVRNDSEILLLAPFVKRHKRNTMQALETSLKLLAQIDSGVCPLTELVINQKVLKEECV